MFLNLAFVPQMERSWAPLHNRSGLRLGKVSPVFLSVLVIFSIWISFPFSPVFISITFRQRSTIKLHPHRIELQQPVRHIKGTFESTTATFIIFGTFSETVVDYFSFQSKPPKKFLLRTNIVRPQWTSGTGWPSRPLGKPFMWETSSSVMDCRCQKTKAIQIDGIAAKKNNQVYIFSFSPRCTWAWLRTPCGVWSHTLRSCSHTTRYFLTSAKSSHSPPDNFNKTFLKWAFDITCHYALITPPLSSQWPPP